MDLTDYSNVLEESQQIINQCFEKYELSDVFLSFNGGKDCTVLLDLTLNALKVRFPNSNLKQFKIYYIRPENPFPELEKFIFQTEERLKLKIIVVTDSIKDALEKIVNENRNMKACLMGTRSTDPYCENLHHFEMTDKNWPQLMRVSPLLHWSYHQIWSYLLKNKVAYCQLYDLGYTSIGTTNNTIPNPALKDSTNGQTNFKPAYLLQDGSLERSGRVKNFTNGKL